MRSIIINSADGVSVDINKYDNAPAPSPEGVWTRPSDWLPLPEVDGTQQIVSILYAVDNSDYNKVNFYTESNVIINWGDGNIENYSAGSSPKHDYVFSSIPSATQTTEGYRQVIITITPQTGNNFTYLYGDGFISSGALDIVASGSLLTADLLRFQPRLQHAKMMCKIGAVIESSALVSLEFQYDSVTEPIFGDCPNLKYIPNFNTVGLGDYCSFGGCSSLINLPEIDYSVFSDFTEAFRDCTSITSTPPIVLTGTPSMLDCFRGCIILYKANIIGTPSSILRMFFGCVNLLEVPPMDLSFSEATGTFETANFSFDYHTSKFKAFGMKNTLVFNGYDVFPVGNNQRFSRTTLIELMTNLGLANAGAKLRISGCIGFNSLTNSDKAIATNKGWIIT